MIFPDAVNIKGDILKITESAIIDENGKIITPEVKEIIVKDAKDLNTGDLMAYVIKAIQEQQIIIQNQQTQIDEMREALCNLGQTQFCENLYYCEDEDTTMECPGGIGGTTRCYLDETQTTWDSCASGWILD